MSILTALYVVSLWPNDLSKEDYLKASSGRFDVAATNYGDRMMIDLGYRWIVPALPTGRWLNHFTGMNHQGIAYGTWEYNRRASLVDSIAKLKEGYRHAYISVGRLDKAMPKDDPWRFELGCRLEAPLTLIALLLLIQPLAWLLRPRPHRAGFCRRCGYDLRASAARCPECGTSFYESQIAGDADTLCVQPERIQRFRLALRLAILVFCMKLITVFLWVYPFHRMRFDPAWPSYITLATSGPLMFSRFVDSPPPDVFNLITFLAAIAVNTFLWGYILARAFYFFASHIGRGLPRLISAWRGEPRPILL